MKKILNAHNRQFITYIILIVIILIFQYTTKSVFLSPVNVSNLLMQCCYLIIFAIGLFIVMITYNIDLSIYGVASFISALSGVLMIKNNMDVVPAVILCLLVGALIGAVQGFIIDKLKIPSLVLTIISLMILAGVYPIFSINAPNHFPKLFETMFSGFISGSTGNKYNILTSMIIGIIFTLMYIIFLLSERTVLMKQKKEVKTKGRLLVNIVIYTTVVNVFMYMLAQYKGVPYALVLLGVIIFIYSLISVKSSAGRELFAVSVNEKSVRVASIKANHFIIIAFINMGILAALAGLFLTSRINYVIPVADSSFLYDAILACYIGNTSVFKGTGSIRGVLSGCMIIGVVNNGMSLMATTILWDNVKFLILIIAVIVDVYTKPKYSNGLLNDGNDSCD